MIDLPINCAVQDVTILCGPCWSGDHRGCEVQGPCRCALPGHVALVLAPGPRP